MHQRFRFAIAAELTLLLAGCGQSPNSRPVCPENIHNLGHATLIYVYAKDQFPPAYTTDASGNRLHSWRTILLPYMEQQDLFARFKMDEPWNSEHNSPATKVRPAYLHCPADDKAGESDTSYVAVVGPGTIWSATRKISMSDIKDGPADTLLFIEMKNSGIHWAEPRDLELDNLPPGVTKQNFGKVLSNHPGGFFAVFADGHIEFIPSTIPWEQFEAMSTYAGKEIVTRGTWYGPSANA